MKEMSALYLHIPFCTQRCIYCDFFSQTEMAYRADFVEALIEEMRLRRDYLAGEAVETVYLGGGTPSQLTVEELARIFDGLARYFDLSACREVTLEANPDDITMDYLRALRHLPINRISMGVQSFDADDLVFLRRRHDREQAIRAVRLCQEQGLTNISIDLIYGLPGQTRMKWDVNLEEALRLDIPHISAYHLIYEEGTALYRLLEKGSIEPLEEDESLEVFSRLIDRLAEVGYEHYEISNFARPGYHSRHNSSYWEGKKYLGLGPSAHSYDGKSREWNVSSLPTYIRFIQEGTPEIEREVLSLKEQYNDYVITRLRTAKGIDLRQVELLFGADDAAYCRQQSSPFIKNGWLKSEEDRLVLSRRGLFLSDGVMRELIR